MSPTRSVTRTRSSPATCSSRARSAVWTCPAGTGPPCLTRFAPWSTRTRRRRRSTPGTWASPRWGPSGRRTRSSPSSHVEPEAEGAPRHVRCPARGGGGVRPPPAGGPAPPPLEQAARGLFERAGYGLIETPVFEDTELFERGVGDSTDIVRKEMFTFEDQGGRSLTLRPEGTAPICRAYVEHGMHKLAQPVKLWYLGPFFRHERPQAGRYREFHQVGAEAIGTDSPLADAELIVSLDELRRELGVPGIELRLGSLGSLEPRRAYVEELKAYL